MPLGHSFTLNVPHLPVILLERYQRSLGQGGGHPSPSSSGDHGSPSAGKPLLGPFNAQTLSFVFFGCLSAANAIREFYAKRLARQTHNRDFVNAIQKVLDERDDNKRETASGSGDDNAQDTPRNFELVGHIDNENVYLFRPEGHITTPVVFFRRKRYKHVWEWSIDCRNWLATSTREWAIGPPPRIEIHALATQMIARLEAVRLLSKTGTVHHPPSLEISETVREAESVPEALTCPITHAVMANPVVAPSGVTYEKFAIERWILERGAEPTTGRPLRASELYPNLAIRTTIEAFAANMTPANKPVDADDSSATADDDGGATADDDGGATADDDGGADVDDADLPTVTIDLALPGFVV